VSISNTIATSSSLVEALELVRLDRGLVGVERLERVLATVVVSVIVSIDGLGLEAGDGVELLDGGGTEPGQSTEHGTLDLSDLSVLDGIDEDILGVLGVVLELLGGVLLSERSDLVEVHLQVVGHLLSQRGRLLLQERLGSGDEAGHGEDLKNLHLEWVD